MTNFTELLSKTTVAISPHGVTSTGKFGNHSGAELLAMLRKVQICKKDGSHFLRTSLKLNNNGDCLARSNINCESLANLLIVDCDKRIDEYGEILEGAPNPQEVSRVLNDHNLAHILYGSYSHYVGEKGNRYRIILLSDTPYNSSQLAPTIEALISLINIGLDRELLANATENNTWAQPWYLPRKIANSSIPDLYIEHLEGETFTVFDQQTLPPLSSYKELSSSSKQPGEISAIQAFNQQHALIDLLIQYGYKKVYESNENQKWLSPLSKSGIAGITVRTNKFYSHHDDEFNDGYWHDAFDLMRAREGLSKKEAIIKAAKNSIAPDGGTVDEYNKSLMKIKKCVPAGTLPHAKILKSLLDKIPSIDFRKEAKLDEDEKIRTCHYQILTIEKILEIAQHNHWGLCRKNGFIYLYNGEFWSLLDEDTLKSFLGEAAEKIGIDKFSARYFNFKEQLYKQFIASAIPPNPEQPNDSVFVNLKNGTFEITPKGTRLKSFNHEDFLTYQLPFKYEPNAKCPMFLEYLNKVLPTIELQNILAEYLGYVFIKTSTLKLEQALILFGSGANGKSVFYEVVTHLFGNENTSTYSLQTLTNDTGYQRAMIANKLVNYASEVSGKLEASIFKQLVSGEPVEARLPYGNPFIMSDYAKLIFNCNELPWNVEYTNAYYRRFLIIPFDITIPENEQDKELAKKIIDGELSGVFNWVLNGLQRVLLQKKFTDSEVVRQARSQYEKESDSVKLFLDEASYTVSLDDYVTVQELYHEYQRFCVDDGYHAVSKLKFRKRLEHAKIKTGRKNTGNIAFVKKNRDGYNQAKWGE